MGVLTNRLPATQRVAFDTKDKQSINNGVSVTIAQANQPWHIRGVQASNTQSIANNTLTQIGFDTTNINTYQAVGYNTFNLRFGSISSGGHSYPYSNIILPQYGIYEVEFAWMLVTTAGGASIEMNTLFYVNGGVYSDTVINQPADFGHQVNSGYISDTYQGNPGDTLALFVYQVNSAAAALPTFLVNTWYNVKYMGLN